MRPFRCWFGHAMVTQSDDTHLWGECVRCGKRAGLVTRQAVRRVLEAEERQREFDRLRAQMLAEKPR
jgi:hypothetical protein